MQAPSKGGTRRPDVDQLPRPTDWNDASMSSTEHYNIPWANLSISVLSLGPNHNSPLAIALLPITGELNLKASKGAHLLNAAEVNGGYFLISDKKMREVEMDAGGMKIQIKQDYTKRECSLVIKESKWLMPKKTEIKVVIHEPVNGSPRSVEFIADGKSVGNFTPKKI